MNESVSCPILESIMRIYDSQNFVFSRWATGIYSRIVMSATPQKNSPVLSIKPVKAAVRSLYLTNKFSAETPTLVNELLTKPENSSSPILEMKVTC